MKFKKELFKMMIIDWQALTSESSIAYVDGRYNKQPFSKWQSDANKIHTFNIAH